MVKRGKPLRKLQMAALQNAVEKLSLNENTPTAHSEDQISTFPQRRKNKPFPRNLQPTTPTENMAIEEALKNEISVMPMKTPVSILQELLSRRGITPTYELVQIEGAIHEPTFRYRVSFNDKDAMGAGRSKKEAKHAAAKALIDKLTGHLAIGGEQMEAALETMLGPSGYDDKVMGNPIGWLQEMCMARRWPPPTYETEMEVGLPHERQFTIACTVLKYREVGQGKSKKIAKRIAAHKMYTRLQDSPPDSSQVNQIIDEEANEEINQKLNRYADLKDAHIPTLTNQHSFKVAQFHKSLKALFGKALTKLQAAKLSSPDLNCVQLLQEIASEHQFDVTYVEIEEKTYSDCYQCLVQLSTLPVAVCQGAGETRADAKTSAARNALEYLKIMTTK
ncbi:interferon-inducible double-stranded RNA-dependent protein kinase activator A homolog B isoform X2 [Phlebotomus papatasi]|uniref:interferon-inducible double-stranded RNA-dependent protein kinase activator A homolog B isoform X2 n=1 Tax=Phlebotomus papatasi TaxID=29031 RepID=UPI002483D764|nr:interferon-inducible double-stranded RNA-dependent protein kinase activator A homolog B isoform X2 [Phlebotomus papatasi]